MAKTALLPLQGAIYTRLLNDAPLNEMITGVFDDVPKWQMNEYGNYILDSGGNKIPVKMPYVVLGADTSTPFNTKTSIGENIVTTLHVWSDFSGSSECKKILNLVLQAMTNQPLPIGDGFSLQFSELVQMQVMTDIDGTTRHGTLEIRYYVNN